MTALRRAASSSLDELARVASAFGSEVVAVLLIVLLGSFPLRRRWGTAVSLAVVTVGAHLLNNVLKDHCRTEGTAPPWLILYSNGRRDGRSASPNNGMTESGTADATSRTLRSTAGQGAPAPGGRRR